METHFDAIQNAQPDISREKLKEDIRALVHDAEEMLKVTADNMNDKVKDARSRLTAALERAKASSHQLEDKAAAAAKATDRVIRAHPYESIGVAFGIGVLLGVLVGRK